MRQQIAFCRYNPNKPHSYGLLLKSLNDARFLIHTNTARKTIFSFSKCFENMVFPKKIALEYDLSCIIRKDDISFSRNMILFLDTKRKMIFFKKIHENVIFSSGVLKRWSFQKNSRLNTNFFVTSGKLVFIFSKKYIFSLGGK